MYTGGHLNELCSLELTDVTDDRISLPDSKTDAGERDIPIHRDIQQVIERLKQTSTDGFLISDSPAIMNLMIAPKPLGSATVV